jgi:hypothetical protein
VREDRNVMGTEEDRTGERRSDEGESAFAWGWHVMGAAVFCAMPEALSGGLVRLFAPDGGPANWWLIGGGVLGAIAGVPLAAGDRN